MTTDALFETPGGRATSPGETGAAGAPLAEPGAEEETTTVALAPVPAVSALTPHVIGIDVSLTATGIACTHGASLVKSSGKKTDTLEDRQTRLTSLLGRILFDVTRDNCHAGLPRLVVIEAPSYSSQGGSHHDRSGLWWLVVDQLRRSGLRVIEIAPATIKKYGTGKGNADKDAVLSAAIRRLPIDGIDNNNAADAGWLAAIGHDLLGQPLCDLPAVNRAAIDKHRTTVLPPDHH